MQVKETGSKWQSIMFKAKPQLGNKGEFQILIYVESSVRSTYDGGRFKA